MLGWSLLRHPDCSMAKYPPAATSKVNNPGAPVSSDSLTEQHVPWLIQVSSEHMEGGVEVCIFEEPVVVVVRHTGVLHISADKNYFGNVQKIWWQ